MEHTLNLNPKHLGIQVFDLLSRPGIEDRERAKVIAEALETIQDNYPNLAYTATQRDLSETELRLTKEIEVVRSDLTKEIELVHSEIKETELKLTKEINKQTMITVTAITSILGLLIVLSKLAII